MTCVLLVNGCDSLTPEDFKAKNYTPPSIDVRASDILSRTVIDSLGRTIGAACYVVTTRAMWIRSQPRKSLVDSTTRANNTDNQIILSKYDALIDSLSPTPVLRDTITGVQIDTTNNTAYARFNVVAGEPNNIYIYTSFRFNEANVDHYVTVQLVRSDTSLVSYDDIMTQEASYARTVAVTTAGGDKVVSTIRSRSKFLVDTGNYLVRFTMSDARAIKSFKLLILSM
jgi:hypothetical protein